MPYGVQLSENVPVTGTSTNKYLLNINSISKLIHFLQPLYLNRQQIVDDTCYACSSSHYVTTILIHFHNCCRSDMQTSQDPNFIFDTQLHCCRFDIHTSPFQERECNNSYNVFVCLNSAWCSSLRFALLLRLLHILC